ncbi:MAG: hypothetical protein ACRD5E_09915 [Nitrososphaeraceae archaeon]
MVEVLISIFVLGAHLISLDLQVLQVRRVTKEIQESKVSLEKKVRRVTSNKQGNQGSPDIAHLPIHNFILIFDWLKEML